MFVGYVDTATALSISGWAWNVTDNKPTTVVMVFPDGFHRRIPANLPRPDVAEKLGNDTRCGFAFLPTVNEKYAGCYSIQFEDGTLVPNGTIYIEAEPIRELVEGRWRQDEAAADLTWGRIMTGDSFVAFMLRNGLLARDPQKYLEIGPGYGRILRSLLDRDFRIARYLGIELSWARTRRLRASFAGNYPNIDFQCASCETMAVNEAFDVIFSSSTFEHLHPDFSIALNHIGKHVVSGGHVYIDFIQREAEGITRSSTFETGAFVRVYSIDEITALFDDCGVAIDAIETIVLGEGNRGDGTAIPIKRIAVAGRMERSGPIRL
jgi:SAM-dependent methyltransferase